MLLLYVERDSFTDSVLSVIFASSSFSPGQLLPSARVLSGKLTINPNTVARAFTELQNDGVIESLRGRGMIVCETAVAICRRERDSVLGERIGGTIAEAWHAGLDEKRIRMIVDKHLKRVCKTQPTVHQAALSDDASE